MGKPYRNRSARHRSKQRLVGFAGTSWGCDGHRDRMVRELQGWTDRLLAKVVRKKAEAVPVIRQLVQVSPPEPVHQDVAPSVTYMRLVQQAPKLAFEPVLELRRRWDRHSESGYEPTGCNAPYVYRRAAHA